MSREELKEHIFRLQEFIENEQKAGKDVDTILDETDIFDEFEDVLPDDEFPIFVITILNGFNLISSSTNYWMSLMNVKMESSPLYIRKGVNG